MVTVSKQNSDFTSTNSTCMFLFLPIHPRKISKSPNYVRSDNICPVGRKYAANALACSFATLRHSVL